MNDGILNVAAFETDTSDANSFLKIDLGAGNDKEFVRVEKRKIELIIIIKGEKNVTKKSTGSIKTKGEAES